jgi:hypothetical protein
LLDLSKLSTLTIRELKIALAGVHKALNDCPEEEERKLETLRRRCGDLEQEYTRRGLEDREKLRSRIARNIRYARKIIGPKMPRLAAHLKQSIHVGTSYCRYENPDRLPWRL